MKLGIGVSVDAIKLQKELFYAAQSGAKYINLQMFINTDEQDQYGNNGGVKQVTQDMSKEQKQQQPFVGNAKVFYKSDSAPQQQGGFQPQQQGFAQQPSNEMGFDDDIPF